MAASSIHQDIPEAWEEDATSEEQSACCHGAMDYLRSALRQAEELIAQEPAKAVLIAAGLGFLAGIINLRRR